MIVVSPVMSFLSGELRQYSSIRIFELLLFFEMPSVDIPSPQSSKNLYCLDMANMTKLIR